MSKMNHTDTHTNVQVITASPCVLETLDYNDLRSSIREIKDKIRNTTGANRHKLEEQYCYVVRELELRQSSYIRSH